MAGLKGVIQLRRFQLDEKRRELAGFERLATQLTAERAVLNEDIQSEKRSALMATDPEAAFAFGAFVQGAVERRKRLDQSITRVETQIATANEELRAAFADLKKFEQAQAQRLAMEARRVARIESMQLDEIGIEGFRRRAAEAS